MKILVTGIKGQLGYDVMKALEERGHEAVGADIEEFDITDLKAVCRFITLHKPDAVIHCAAYTAVDKAEEDQETCRNINVIGTRNIAQACSETYTKMIYLSTDYVFPGTGSNFFEVNDPTTPLNAYGKSKYEGEQAIRALLKRHFIVRTSWVFGINGRNFVKTMLHLGRENNELNVVSDQIGSPTYTVDLAALLCDMAASDKFGTYHATNEGVCSRAEFTEEIFRLVRYNVKVNSVPTSAYPTKAQRPLNSRLSKRSLDEAGFYRLPPWQDALKRYIQILTI